jgi:4-hydroxy-2-oxoheptanedioate aldolase
MFPRIDSIQDAEKAVAAMRYPPAGTRGLASSTRATAYGKDFPSYFAGSSSLLTIVQVESLPAVEHVNAIAAIEGVDMLFLGPWDLSLAMGCLGDFQNPDFARAVRRTGEAAARHGKAAGILLPAGHTVETYHAMGYRFIVSGSDSVLLSQAARNLTQSLQSQCEALPNSHPSS